MKILAIDTSCDDTAAAVTEGRKVLSNELYSQILIHKKWGGVVPDLAMRAHQDHIDEVVERALKKAKVTMKNIDAVAVTYGPGLAIALGVGIAKAKELSLKHNKPLVAVNHMEGHVYSVFAQNSKGNPDFEIEFPYLVLLVSGGHTEMLLMHDHLKYEVLGETLDDAAGEALDKGARMIIDDSVYPGGPVLEKLAHEGDENFLDLPRPMSRSAELDFSYSGLKTALLYALRDMADEHKAEYLHDIAASYQKAVVDSLLIKMRQAMKRTHIDRVAVGGGVAANAYLRKRIRAEVKKRGGSVIFPPVKKLNGDNAAMIGIAACFRAKKGQFVKKIDELDRDARADINTIRF